ncbi:response regulator transcription factor [Paraclostridium sp. AKS73]|uniref:response regulator transcription factor n=1 Tax=Paraclostridium sp. AKS73 TaxID=2876116 RepID=UPI002FCD6238
MLIPNILANKIYIEEVPKDNKLYFEFMYYDTQHTEPIKLFTISKVDKNNVEESKSANSNTNNGGYIILENDKASFMLLVNSPEVLKKLDISSEAIKKDYFYLFIRIEGGSIMNEKILILEDEIGIRSFVSINLKREGYEVVEAGTGQEAIDKITNEKNISIALLDVMLPDMSGIDVCKHIRSNFDSVGIIMLTAKSQEEDKIEGFISGADDYMVKPFSIKELLMRVSALSRRINREANAKNKSIIESGPFVLDLEKRKLTKNNSDIELTPTEFSIVKFLITNEKQSLSRDQILDEVWGTNYLYDFKIVDVNIRRIRNKIEDDPSKPKFIQTVWGYGYCWRKEEQ